MNTEPLRDFLDVVACGRRPSAADLAATLDEALASAPLDGGPDRDALHRHLTRVTRSVMEAAQVGNSGEARRIAAAELAAIRATSTTTTDRVDPDVIAAVNNTPRTY